MEVVAKIVRIIAESPRVKRFFFDFALDFVPGQWVMLWSDSFCVDGEPVKRAYSVVSSPGEMLELCVARGKQFSAFLNDSKIGDEFHVKGPFGNFKLCDNKNVFFIAAGTGIAPFVPMVKQAIAEGRNVKVICSVRSRDEVLYADWLSRLESVDVVITLTREVLAGYEHGRVPSILPRFFVQDYDYYLCGFFDFVEGVASGLKKLGAQKILYDVWG